MTNDPKHGDPVNYNAKTGDRIAWPGLKGTYRVLDTTPRSVRISNRGWLSYSKLRGLQAFFVVITQEVAHA